MLLGAVTLDAQAPRPQLKPTEQVVKQYLKLVGDGALLTPEGWQKAQKLFTESDQYPNKGPVFLLTLGNFGEMWVEGNKALVETKWTDYMGKVDSALRYYPPEGPHVTMTGFRFPLLFTNEHREVGANGMTTREVTGAWEWKIEGPHQKWATVEKTIIWLNEKSDQTSDLVIKKNAEKTIAILKHLGKPCGNASAC